jgi:hypothetical protein
LAGQLNATRELARKVKKFGEMSRSNKSVRSMQVTFYEKAAEVLDSLYKSLRRKHEVAKFIYEELQLAPWHLTGELIEVHKKAEGTGMMKLTGLGDPSGVGEGFSFLREVDAKPSKSVGTGPTNDQIKKITGTEDDLRKLTMKQMGNILKSYGMAQKQIDTLKVCIGSLCKSFDLILVLRAFHSCSEIISFYIPFSSFLFSPPLSGLHGNSVGIAFTSFVTCRPKLHLMESVMAWNDLLVERK